MLTRRAFLKSTASAVAIAAAPAALAAAPFPTGGPMAAGWETGARRTLYYRTAMAAGWETVARLRSLEDGAEWEFYAPRPDLPPVLPC